MNNKIYKYYKHTVLVVLTTLMGTTQLSAQVNEGTWALNYPIEEFTDEAVLDLRYLNEDEAGSNGFIKLSANGESFVNGNGDPVRFWAVGGANDAKSFSDPDIAEFMRFLAKKGVNMIRFHGGIHSVVDDINAVNTEEVDAIWRAVAAAKKEGIYTTISPFWAGHVSNMRSAWGLGEYVGDTKPWGLMFFDDKFKNAYKHWVEYLYTETNPYTGIALKDDPAVGLIQIKNEDGVFFYTIQNVEPYLLELIEKQFYNWLIGEYGTIEAAYEAWGNLTLEQDDISNGKIGQYAIWEATQEQTGSKQKRLTDQIKFYADVQRDFYQDVYDHYRQIGCKQLINASNWKTADPLKLFDTERWTQGMCEVMAVNRYYAPNHIGSNNGWRIEPGHNYQGLSVLKYPHKLPINTKQVKGKPFIISESAWNLPHKYQAEGPFLIAAYSALSGFDAYYWFSPNSKGIHESPYFDFTEVDGQFPMHRWTVSTPGQMSMFPANALMFRKGYIKEGSMSVYEERTLESMMERETPIISEDNSFDPNRDDSSVSIPEGETEVSNFAYLTGKVRVKYEGNPSNNIVSGDLGQLIDIKNKKIKSNTSELSWDYKNGMCLLDAPLAKGICGFPGDQPDYELTGVKFSTSSEYIVANVVSMDDQPIAESEEILIQVGSVYRPTNWSESAATFTFQGENVEGFRIDNVGEMPWRGTMIDLKISIVNDKIQSAHVLDLNGYEKRETTVKHENGFIIINVPANAMYIVLNTEEAVPLSIDNKEDTGMNLKIYPNPSSNQFHIDVPPNLRLNNSYLEVVDLSGQIVFKSGYLTSSSYDFSLNEENQGIYQVLLKSQGQIIARNKMRLK